ncbi:uncharacterized protein FOBCDRAFT_197898 [Fusarium oxysporum Fo47]|uniref:uncharacterized protein n=1 Tax=Fusarium oxysporum Fo47 TaxID=660027 RepID=UPI002869A18D|nr:uncharacterized protein FOBCDRAFT_197898 [Fusarium oxysporum Fo47]QKD50493.2 hypothetical protein FOBCDRAFT_197898 [Fusarium oxysporum Fo47]
MSFKAYIEISVWRPVFGVLEQANPYLFSLKNYLLNGDVIDLVQLDLPIPIQEFFTLAYGVSAGALIVLAMFANGWSVERCGVEFQKLAKSAFRPPLTASVPGVNWIRAILLDLLYSETDIEIALKSVFGEKAFTEVAQGTRGYMVLIAAENIKTWEVGRSALAALLYF